MKESIDHSSLADSRWLTLLIYISSAVVLYFLWSGSGLSWETAGIIRWTLAVFAWVISAILFSVSLFEVVTYFVFMPSIRSDAHIFSTVHANRLIHPLTTSIVLAALAACILSRSTTAWLLWWVSFTAYVVQTSSILKHILEEQSAEAADGPQQSLLGKICHLILGTGVVTLAAGAKAIAPWKIKSLPEDTWIVDVRTKAEFQWNRLHGAHNFPWGSGLAAAAKDAPKDRPVLVTCLSGHRSPPVAVMLRKLGFENVYNLNWGLLYLILLERGKKGTGVFDLTRPNRVSSERGKDYKGISYGYIGCAVVILFLAPFENVVMGRSTPGLLKMTGAFLGLLGLFTGWLAFKSLGRNFRVFAAPRRSGVLIRTGVYGKVRHPMYTAVIVGFAGYVIYWGSLWSLPFWLALTILYVIKAIKEEDVLAQRFEDYQEYKSVTKRFVPYLF